MRERASAPRNGVRTARVLLLAAASCGAPRELEAPPPQPPARGMVVCEHALAAEVGARILERGGNAADAAVATALALAVVYPQAGNLGGGGFAVWVPNTGDPRALDFRETAPSSATPGRYTDAQGAHIEARSLAGPFSVGTPGSPAGLWALYRELGSGQLTLEELAAPAIELAREGFRVDARLARDLAEERECFAESPAALRLFYPRGEPLAIGDKLVQPELAQTLERFAQRGPEGFYLGETAKLVADELARRARSEGYEDSGGPGGFVTAKDLRDYNVRWRAPLIGWFRGMEIVTMPPPSAGGIALLQTLGVLDGFPIESERARALRERAATGRGGAEASGLDDRIVHWWIEALRRAFEARAAYLGDPDFVVVPVSELLSPRWLAEARVQIGESAARTAQASPDGSREGAQTTHLSVVDRRGNALALTTTLNSDFGSGILVEGAGFLLNNELDDFSFGTSPNQFDLVGSAANAIAGGKRPISSMTPTILRDSDRRVVLVLGSPGGPRIITAVVGVLLRVLVFGESLSAAVGAPRLHQQAVPSATEFEPGWTPELLDGLERRGHAVRRKDEPWGSVQAIRVGDDREPEGVSDPRSPGAARAEER